MTKPNKKNIYLDYAAATPVRLEVLFAMNPYWADNFANPSSLYKAGIKSKLAVEDARKSVAKLLNSRPEEIVFTAGGSESINLAILGIARKYRETHKTSGHIITSTIEHHAVLHTVEHLTKEGFTVTKISVDKQGFFNLEELKQAIKKDTILISLMYANNEIGTIEPIPEISKWLIQKNKARAGERLEKIYFHTDACQAAGQLGIQVDTLGIDLMSLNGSKIYGPKQTGCLYIRTGTKLAPIIFGGGQEKDLRSGTENVPGIVGFTKALELVQKEQAKESKRLSTLRDYTITQIQKSIPSAILNGPDERRLPNNISISFADTEGESVMFYLDALNISVSTGSACTSTSNEPSHVLKAINLKPEYIEGSIRITIGRNTTKKEIDFLLQVLPEIIKKQRGSIKLQL